MYGGYLTEPVSATADFGIIFLHNEGYSDYCGHGVIALSTAAVELGWSNARHPKPVLASMRRADSSKHSCNGMASMRATCAS